jgi:hypothetical protein
MCLHFPTGPNQLIGTKIDVTSLPYDANATGKIDATAAIRAAVRHACAIGGGAVVYFPAGTYKVSIQTPNEIAAIPIGCDSVTIEGEGKDRSVISVFAYGDQNPDSTCPVFNTRDGQLTVSKDQPNTWATAGHIKVVNRGSAFWVYGTRSTYISATSELLAIGKHTPT